MLRLGHCSTKITRGLHASFRNDSLFPSPCQKQHGVSKLRALCSSEQARVNNSSGHNNTSTPASSEQESRVGASRKRLAASPALNLPSVLLGASSRRPMSTAAGTGNNSSSGDAAATADIAPGDMAAAADAAMAASGAADQAQAAMEVAPETFKMALYTPPQLAMMAMDSFHAATGMPYWMTIVSITLGIRMAILPIGLLGARNGARTAAMKPEMDALQESIKNDQQSSQPRRAERYRQETKALYKKYGTSVLLTLAPVVQLPLFIGFWLGLQRMPGVVPEFATGGALWFQDLGAPDPYMVFPVLTGVTMLAMTTLGDPGGIGFSAVKAKAGMRGMALLVIPFTMNIPTGVFVYWTTSNFFSILQTLVFKSAFVTRYFNFPDVTPKKLESGAAEKELDWFDVLGGDNPIKEYRKMQKQREVQTWFREGEGGGGPRAGRGDPVDGGSVEREGAPFHAPPSMAGPAIGAAVAPGPKIHRSKPQLVLHAVRPKPAGNTSNGKTAKRGSGKSRGKSHAI